MDWKALGATHTAKLAEARLQLHYASQVVAAAAIALLPPQPDDSHPNLAWDDARGALVGRALGDAAWRLSLGFASFEVRLLDAHGAPLGAVPLDGIDLRGLFDSVGKLLEAHGVVAEANALEPTPYALPPHRIADGGRFERPPEPVLCELAAWFATAGAALQSCADEWPGSADVRVWPHHFDVGSLFSVTRDAEGQATATVGFGLSPGDEMIDEPYYYVSAWPAPEQPTWPPLASPGHWLAEGFVGAVLTRAELPTDDRRDAVEHFLGEATHAVHAVLGDTSTSA